MALQKNKIHVEGTTYEIAQAEQANISGTSDDKDTSNSNTWTDIEPLEDEEINSNIFNKMSKMFSNVRYLYNELGTGADSNGSSRSVKSQLNDIRTGTAPLKHRHSVVDKVDNIRVIPTNDIKSDSNDTLPTCALLSQLDTALTTVEKKINDIDTAYKANPNNRIPIGNGRHMGTFNTTADVNNFCAKYNSTNKYGDLRLGDYITINDGIYNANWMIAGFDTEENNGSLSGKGICLIPQKVLPMLTLYDTILDTITPPEWNDKRRRYVSVQSPVQRYMAIPYYRDVGLTTVKEDSENKYDTSSYYIDYLGKGTYRYAWYRTYNKGKEYGIGGYSTCVIEAWLGRNNCVLPILAANHWTSMSEKEYNHIHDPTGAWYKDEFIGYSYKYFIADRTGKCWSYKDSNLNDVINNTGNKNYPMYNLFQLLGSHIINRNIQFSVPSAIAETQQYFLTYYNSTNYLTTPNQYQLYGKLRSPYYRDLGYHKKILPVFNYIDPNIDGYPYIIRDVGRWDPYVSDDSTSINFDWGRMHNRYAPYTATWGIGELQYGPKAQAMGAEPRGSIAKGFESVNTYIKYYRLYNAFGQSALNIGTLDKKYTASMPYGRTANNEVIYMRPYMYIR